MEFELKKIAASVGGEIQGNAQKKIVGPAPFSEAGSDEITFAGSAKFLRMIDDCKAGAVIVPRGFQSSKANLLCVENPQVAFAKVVNLFYPPPRPEAAVHPSACIGDNFVCGRDVAIGPHVVIQNNVTIGNRVTLHPNSTIADDVRIGDDVLVHPNVAILGGSRIGNRVTIHSGTVIGSDGYGFAPDGDTYYKIPHLGIVQIDDDVEIGANNTIDRATFGKTWIRRGVKTDNLVQIAHNVTVGEDTLLVSQVGISGSVTIGSHVIMAGQAGVAGHLSVGDNATIGPQAGVAKSVPEGATVLGAPAMPHQLFFRIQRTISKLPELKKKLEDLEKRLNRLEAKEG